MINLQFFPSRRMAGYLARLFITRSAAVLFSLVLVLMTLDLLANTGNILAHPGNGDAELWRYVGLRVPQLIARFLPFSVLLGTLVSLVTLNQHSEIISMKAAGISAHQIIAPLIVTGLLIAVVNFPAGAATSRSALEEGIRAVEEGAGELDVVVPPGWLRAREFTRARDFVAGLVAGAHVPVKAIVEATFFTDEDLDRIGREVVAPSGASFFKTGTGVYGGGLSPERIRLLRAALPETLRLKVSGGIRDAEAASAVHRAVPPRAAGSSTA